jgi:flagellar L-ring protein precursor FlgH
MKLRQLLLMAILILVGISQSGCSTFGKKVKAFLNGSNPNAQVATARPASANAAKFSGGGDISPKVRRQYRRTTKESLSEESALDAKSGSLWVMEGQGAYLFSQNIVRMVGDPIGVQIEGEPKEQLQGKADVIRTLLTAFEARQKARLRGPAGEEQKAKGKGEKEETPEAKAAAEKAAAEKSITKEQFADLNIKTVPTRIVERTLDGNYRVKGTQPFMIGSREYKVIVTGIVRAEDFNEEGISAAKLLDPKFDIVSARRKEEM